MSVLACDRYNCPEIMCDRLIMNGSKYICSDCWYELLEYKETWKKHISNLAEVEEVMENFFRSKPGTYIKLNNDNAEEMIDKEFDRLTQ